MNVLRQWKNCLKEAEISFYPIKCTQIPILPKLFYHGALNLHGVLRIQYRVILYIMCCHMVLTYVLVGFELSNSVFQILHKNVVRI